LPASQHIGTTGTIKDNLARLLDGTDACPPGKQSACREQGNEKDYDHFNAHKRARLYYLFQSARIIVRWEILRALARRIRFTSSYGYKQ
jgi:hypothetical protein